MGGERFMYDYSWCKGDGSSSVGVAKD